MFDKLIDRFAWLLPLPTWWLILYVMKWLEFPWDDPFTKLLFFGGYAVAIILTFVLYHVGNK